MSEENKNPLIESFLKIHDKHITESGGAGIAQTKTYRKPDPVAPVAPVAPTQTGPTNNVIRRPELMDTSSIASKIRTQQGIANGTYNSVSSVKPVGTIAPEQGNYTVNKLKDKAETFARAATGDIGDVVGLTDPKRGEGLRKFNPGAAQAGDLAGAALTIGLPERGMASGAAKLADKGAEGFEILKKGVYPEAGKYAKEINPTPALGTAGRAVARTADDVSKDLGGFGKVSAGAKALPGASETSKALGGFGKVPMGKAAAVGAGALAAGAAMTAGSKPAGEASATETTPAAKQPEKYKIAKGDNLSTLAQKWGVSVGDIMKHNQGIKDPNKIYAGAELVRPEKTGNPIYKDNIGTKSGPKKSQNIQKEENEMSNPLISAFIKLQDMKTNNIFEAAKKVKKLDPVGKEDEDVDNDGKVDSSDKYLKNRREKIAKAMKEAKDPYGENDGGVYKSPPRPTTDEEKPKLKPSVTKTDAKKKETTVYKQQSEEITFSEAELEHIASILEGPVAPISQDSNTSFGKGASRTGTLTDETNLKKKLKEEAEELEEAKRGRKPGVKVGAYGPRGAKKGESGEGGAVAGNPAVPHPFHQIRSQRPDSEGNYTVQHDTGSGIISAKVPAGHAAKFHNSYLATEKPRDKEALTHDFVQSAFKLEAPKAKSGISLPKMPSPKS